MTDAHTDEAPGPIISTSTGANKAAQAIRRLQDARNRRQQLVIETAPLNETAALDLNHRVYIDEVFLVLALLGEALLPLQIFDNAHYPTALDDVQTSIVGGGHEIIHMAFGELGAELQYVVTAGLAFCATFAPMPVYRGFGAAVLGDWQWGNPNPDGTVMKKVATKTGTYLGLLKDRGDPQPNRTVLAAFDKIVHLLQVKQLLFLHHKPIISGFAEQQPRYVSRKEKDVKDHVELLEDWTKRIERLGHPGPGSIRVTSWAIPYATWNSSYSCKMFQSRGCWETIMTNQMDPGRMLHAFVCRNNINLADGQVLILPPGSPAESLACWLEGLPGMSHHTLKWQDLNTDQFAENCSKSLRKRLGQFPLPDRFAMRDNKIALRPSISIHTLPASPTPSQTTSPPPYSEGSRLVANEQRAAPGVTELSTERDPVELAVNTASSHNRQLQAVAPASTLNAGKHVSAAIAEIRSLAQIRRKPASPSSTNQYPSVVTPKPLAPGGAKAAASSNSPAGMSLRAPQESSKPKSASTPPLPPKRVLPYPIASNIPDGSQVAAAAGASQLSSSLQGSDHTPIELPTERDPVELGTVTTRRSVPVPKRPEMKQAAMRRDHGSGANTADLNLERAINSGVGTRNDPGHDSQRKNWQTEEEHDTTEAKAILGKNDAYRDQVQTGEATQPLRNSDSNTYLDLLNRVARGELSPQALQEMLRNKSLLTP